MSKVFSIQFFYQDYIVQKSSWLGDGICMGWENGEMVEGFVEGKESVKGLVIQNIGIKDLQEVWPEILEEMESIKKSEGEWRVWSDDEKIGIGVKVKEYV